jgi:hypothetical protein
MSMSMLEETLWGVSVAWQKFFNTGLLGAIITTIALRLLHGSLWRRPIAFLSNPFTYIASLSGICWAGFSLGRLLVTSAMRCTLAPPRTCC